jgi:tryptophanyl-tRNA synthetase
MTRDMAIKYNNLYGEVLKVPEYRLAKGYLRVPGVDGRKMSKSYGNAIGLFEPEKAIKKKIMSIVTSSTAMGEPLDPDNCNVFALHSLLPGPDVDELREAYLAGSIGYGEAKKRLVPKLLDHLAPIRDRYAELQKDPAYVEDVFAAGAKRAHEVARATLDACRRASGFGRQ